MPLKDLAVMPSEFETEVARLEVEVGAAKENLKKTTARLQRLESHLPVLISLVGKQAQHLSALKTESQVVSLPDYRDMRMKHNQYHDQIAEAKTLIIQVKNEVKARTTAVPRLEAELASVRAQMNSRGILLEFRKKP